MEYTMAHLDTNPAWSMKNVYQLATLAYVLKHVFQMLRSVSSILSSGNAAHTCFCSVANLPWVSCIRQHQYPQRINRLTLIIARTSE